MSNTNSRKPEQEHPPPPSESIPDESEISNFTCEICMEPMSPPNEQFTNNGLCVHPFCNDCITKYVQVKVEHDHVAEIKCPGLNCHKWLDPICCSTLIPPKLLEKWCDLLCERSLLGLDRCYCPNRLCSALVVNECGGIVKRSRCPDCNKLFCFFCKLPWHQGYRCEESGALRDKDDVAFALLSEKNRWMRCPQCGHCVERVYGCSVINCRFSLSRTKKKLTPFVNKEEDFSVGRLGFSLNSTGSPRIRDMRRFFCN